MIRPPPVEDSRGQGGRRNRYTHTSANGGTAPTKDMAVVGEMVRKEEEEVANAYPHAPTIAAAPPPNAYPTNAAGGYLEHNCRNDLFFSTQNQRTVVGRQGE